jgi:tripartite-type tricarboxylate transporter receptor subunit TctC
MDTALVKRRTALAAAAAALAAPAALLAQEAFPSRVINLVVPFPPGGGTDVVGRLIAQHLGEVLPQKVIVVNRGGAGGMVGSQSVKAAPPDGYTLMFTSQSVVSQTYQPDSKVSHRDFAFLGVLNTDALGLAVPQGSRWRTLQDFVADAKKEPGAVTVGHPGVGSVNHTQILLLEKAAGVKVNAIPYSGSAGTHNAVLAGTTQAAAVVVGDAAALIKDGKMRLLAIMSPTRLEGFPDVPTYRELGVNADFIFWRGMFAHKDTPAPVLATLRQALGKVAGNATFRQQMAQGNFIPAAMLDPAELEAFLKKEEVIAQEVRAAVK